MFGLIKAPLFAAALILLAGTDVLAGTAGFLPEDCNGCNDSKVGPNAMTDPTNTHMWQIFVDETKDGKCVFSEDTDGCVQARACRIKMTVAVIVVATGATVPNASIELTCVELAGGLPPSYQPDPDDWEPVPGAPSTTGESGYSDQIQETAGCGKQKRFRLKHGSLPLYATVTLKCSTCV